ncbi:hypothetical protein ILUMI_21224 [Ignelater luminosus]|uniref:Major facilitator superfamily (MFS) profile domain-containing protein n=1 Tax=Ignelater luminosus TaxID=2038154 RepID=A0A8K0CJ80_IGNLU|nr:hypothetical protein ILUMI_21224 [Ignelater luminosus]
MTNYYLFVNKSFNGWLIFQYIAMIIGTLNLMTSGMHYGWPSPSLPKLLQNDSHIPITSDEGSWIAVILLPGCFSGSVLGGLLLDRIGRKYVILLSSIPFIISWIMIAYARSFTILVTARYLAGISDGLICCSVPIYLGEIADPKIRGLLGSAVSVAWLFGILVINVLGSYLTIADAALISLIVPMLLLLTFPFIPESPYYLLMKGNVEKAKNSLMVFKGTNNVEDELSRLKVAVEEQSRNAGKFTVKSTRRALYITMGSRGAQQFSGTVAIVFYAQIIFKEAGDSVSPEIGSIIYFSVQLILSGICSIIVDKTGRRPLMIISVTGAGIALLIEGVYFYIKSTTDIDVSRYSLIPVVALMIYVIMFALGLQTIPVILLGEIFPTNVKAFAISFSDIYFAVITTTVSKFFQVTKDNFGMHVPFFAFTGCCVLGLLFVLFYLPETKGKTLEEIQEELKSEEGEAISKYENYQKRLKS